MQKPMLKLIAIVDGEVTVMYEGKPTSPAWTQAMHKLGGVGQWRVVCGPDIPFGGYLVRLTDRAVIRAIEA